MNGDSTTIAISPLSSVGDLKAKICAGRGVATWPAKLILGCSILSKDCCMLQDAGIEDGAQLNLVIANPSPEEFDSMYAFDGSMGSIFNKADGHLTFLDSFRWCTQERKAAMLDAVVADRRVRKLTLQRIVCPDTDIMLVAKVLQTSSNLSVVNLSDNAITNQGAIALADAFEHNHTIRELYLFHNPHIGHAGRHRLRRAKDVVKTQEGRLPSLLLYSPE